MTTIDSDLAALTAMVEEFNDYVISNEIFWRLANQSITSARFSQLTLSGMLLLNTRLQTLAPGHPQAQELHNRQAALFERWRSNVQRKALAEVRPRLSSWRWFLDECPEDLHKCGDYYRSEVHYRVYLALLFDLLADDKAAVRFEQQLHQSDGRLRRVWQAGDFIWEPALQTAFDRETFWFLYGRPGG